jgi:hypothetical protein
MTPLFPRLYLTVTTLEPEQISLYNDETKGWTTEKSWFDSQQGKRLYLFFHAFRWVVGPRTHPPIQLVLMGYLPESVGIIESDLQIYLFDIDSTVYHLYSRS